MKKILVVADLHTGSRLGLTPPQYMPEDVAVTQKPLWDWWVRKLAEIGPVDLAICNGDAVDGEGKKEDLEQLTTDTLKQADMAIECLRLVQAPQWYFTWGTPYHTVGSYNYEEPIARAFNTTIRDTQLIRVEDAKFSFRHVVGRSDTAYCQGTQLFKEAVRDLMMAIQEGREDADVIVRSHVHYYWQDGNTRKRAVITPCLQVPASVYGRRMRAFYYTLGMLLITVDGKRAEIEPHELALDLVNKQEYTWIK